jgi:hypothetical protein
VRLRSGSFSVALAVLSCIFALSGTSVSTFGQQATSSPPPVRDAQAVTVVQSAITAMGGAGAVVAITNATITGTEQDSSNPDATPTTFSWQTSGVEFSSTVQNSAGTYTEVSGHGAPAQFKNGIWALMLTSIVRAELPFHLPILALYAEIQNPNITFQFVGSGTVEGKPAIHVHVADNSDSMGQMVTGQEWYFDPASYLPVRVEYKWPDKTDLNYSVPGALEFSDYNAVNGVNVPYQLKIQVSQLVLQATVTSAVFNSGLPASTFDPPEGSIQ